MVDLHLFLGKPLMNAQPEDEEAEADASQSLNTYFGRLPQSLVDEKLELVQRLHNEQDDISSTYKV